MSFTDLRGWFKTNSAELVITIAFCLMPLIALRALGVTVEVMKNHYVATSFGFLSLVAMAIIFAATKGTAQRDMLFGAVGALAMATMFVGMLYAGGIIPYAWGQEHMPVLIAATIALAVLMNLICSIKISARTEGSLMVFIAVFGFVVTIACTLRGLGVI